MFGNENRCYVALTLDLVVNFRPSLLPHLTNRTSQVFLEASARRKVKANKLAACRVYPPNHPIEPCDLGTSSEYFRRFEGLDR
jgi:hypothetical protein